MSAKRVGSEKRSSRGSVKRHSSSKQLVAKRLSSIKENEDNDSSLVVQTIMNEILETALEIIHERYMESQTIKFVVHCAHQALMKFLRIYFYQHTDYARKPEFWGSEEHISPSPPDSWALNQVPVYRNITTEPELNTLSHIKLEMAEKGGEIMTGSQAELISEPSESLLEDVRAIIDEIVDNLPLAEHEFSETDVSSEMSAFTSVVQGQKHYTDFKMKPQLSRIAIGSSTMFKLPRLDVADSGNLKRQSVASDPVEKLPPIRLAFTGIGGIIAKFFGSESSRVTNPTNFKDDGNYKFLV